MSPESGMPGGQACRCEGGVTHMKQKSLEDL
jgi:hypothetical protein